MAGFEAIEVIAHFQILHAHHTLHQGLSMEVQPFAPFERFDKHIEQLSDGDCLGYGLGFTLCSVPSEPAKPDGHASPTRGVVVADPKRCLPNLRGLPFVSPP